MRKAASKKGLLLRAMRLIEIYEPTGCWVWTGSICKAGYGRLKYKNNSGAHRSIWELLVGDIKPGLEIDHLCFVPACINPKHLEPVTAAENIRRSHDRRRAIFYKKWHEGKCIPNKSGNCTICNRLSVYEYRKRKIAMDPKWNHHLARAWGSKS